MATGKMYSCEVKALFKNSDGSKYWKWVEKPVSMIPGKADGVRCMHCHGAVRVHKQQVEHGPGDHVEHKMKQDSENCRGGMYFKGTHKMSFDPVE